MIHPSSARGARGMAPLTPTADQPAETPRARQSRIAVIVVHGVGHHEPAASATAIARLLLRIPENQASHYTAFRQSPLRLPTRRVDVGAPADAPADARAQHRRFDTNFNEGAEYQPATAAVGGGRIGQSHVPPDIALMREQLREYHPTPADQVYESVRLEGHHLTGDASGAKRIDAAVHIYEAYWSDISRVGNAFTSVFGSFYQLVLHLPYLGRLVLNEAMAAEAPPRPRVGRVWRALYVAAMRTLTLAIPLGNLYLLAFGLLLLAAGPSTGLLVPAAITAGTGLAVYGRAARGRRRGWADVVVVALAGGAAAAAALGVQRMLPDYAPWALAAVLGAVVAYALDRVLVAFNTQRPGAHLAGWLGAGAVTVVLVVSLIERRNLAYGVLDTLIWVYVGLAAAWLVFGGLFALSVVCGWVATRGPRPDHAAAPATVWPDAWRRVAVTTRLTLAVPAVLFSAVSLLLWAALMAGPAQRFLPPGRAPVAHGRPTGVPPDSAPYEVPLRFAVYDTVRARRLTALRDTIRRVDGRVDSLRVGASGVAARAPTPGSLAGCRRAVAAGPDAAVAAWDERECLLRARARLQDSVPYFSSARYALHVFEGGSASTLGRYVALYVTGPAILLLLVALAPVLFVEMVAPAASAWPGGPAMPESGPDDSVRLGTWLSGSFRVARWSGWLVTLAVVLGAVLLLAAVPELTGLTDGWPFAYVRHLAAAHADLDGGLLRYGGIILGAGASGVGLIALSKRVSSLGLGLRPALSAALDVDNYLRELPRERTLRALMVERYVSLLRHLCSWRDTADGAGDGAAPGYDAIVIVAHSQGTVLTADVLRFLEWERQHGDAFEPVLNPIAGVDGRRIGVRLFTMGCPLRQLYALRFPHLYGWITPTGAPGWDDTGTTPPTPSPSSLLGVTRWVNAYRSGDYVGRAIWAAPDHEGQLYAPGIRVAGVPAGGVPAGTFAPAVEEYCIGAGAHTHYWDETATAIAAQLDRLICDAISESTSVRA